MPSQDGSLKAITANRLRDGVVVFLGADAAWVEAFADAALFAAADADAALAAAKAQAEGEQFGVDVYAFDVKTENGVPVPVKMRERIRALGPSVRLDLGKQAAA
ncbi:DUF2849 domain-containing protein [Azospirillum doebereinerae]|uniref:DUF2849 domain-containing protein n=1 Tax=Azospirillum doebereinerae TaxID=92933 RepID=UPI001EE5305C|nr:DUF2849 domain-containing protein [Azospirillum doebereinerae]MCG5243276.1 DUF2849 domain-containing protein [Azospirillum doebereinerae]